MLFTFSRRVCKFACNGHRFLSTSSEKFVDVAVDDRKVASVTITRPELHNAFNENVISQLTDAFRSISNASSHPRVVVLRSQGKSFSAGGDINWMQKMINYTYEENYNDANKLFDMFASIRNCKVPVIGRIHGAALGGGSGLVSCCDMAFAVKKAVFGFTEVKIGLVPATIGPFVIRKIGSANASQYFLTGERFDAATAYKIGLVNSVVEDEEKLDELINKTIDEILTASPEAVKLAKQLVYEVGEDVKIEKIKENVCKMISQARTSEEGQEGTKAFLEKRKPKWIKS